MKSGCWGIVLVGSREEEINPESSVSFLGISGKPVVVYSLLAFQQCTSIEGVILVALKEWMEKLVGLVQIFGCSKVKKIVAGSTSRRVSLQNGLEILDPEVKMVTVHEASRPLVNAKLIDSTLAAARRYGCAVAATKISDPVKRVQKGFQVSETLDGDKLWIAQTPQSFKMDLLRQAVAAAAKMKKDFDEESSALEYIQKPVYVVPSSRLNIKILTPDDLALATAAMNLAPLS